MEDAGELEGSLRDAKEDTQALSSTALFFWKLEEAERRKEEGRSGGGNCNGMGLWFANCWFSLIAHTDCQLKILL